MLYIYYDRAIISKDKSYNKKLYEVDAVEIFLTLGRKNRYLELEVNPNGVKYAGIVTSDGGINVEYLNFERYIPLCGKSHKT